MITKMDDRFQTVAEIITVSGMICRACEDAVCEALLQTRGVVSAKASYWKGSVSVEYDPAILSREQLEKRLEESGYPAGNAGKNGLILDLVCAGLVVFIVWFLLTKGLGPAPDASGATSLWELFVVGLLTSTHCLGMCGGILLSQTTDASGLTAAPGRPKRGVGASLAYNGGRVAAYTLMGGIFGALGMVVTYSITTKSIVFTLAGGVVALIGLSMSGVVPGLRRLSPDLPAFCSLPGKARKDLYGKPLIVGLLTGLMPCGPLYAMWLYSMGAGSFRGGALSMLAFSLGAAPLMFLFGALNSFIPKGWMKYMLKFSAVLVLALGLKMLIKGLMLAGVL